VEEAHAAGDREAFRQYGRLNVRLAARIKHLEKAINARSISGRRQHEDATVRVPIVEN
jgi:hypothetical protein